MIDHRSIESRQGGCRDLSGDADEHNFVRAVGSHMMERTRRWDVLVDDGAARKGSAGAWSGSVGLFGSEVTQCSWRLGGSHDGEDERDGPFLLRTDQDGRDLKEPL